MYAGKVVFAQVVEFAPWHTFRRLAAKYRGDVNVRSFSCLDQFLCMAFAQLTYREGLREIEACLGAQPAKLYHLGIRGNVTRSSLTNANEQGDRRIYREFAQALIRIARRWVAGEPLAIELKDRVYALDSSTIELCLSLLPWAPLRGTKAAVKLHMLLALRGAIPTFGFISDGTLDDTGILDVLLPEPCAFYVMDWVYLNFQRLYALQQAGGLFVARAKSNFNCRRIYPERLQRIRYKDPETGKTLRFLTNLRHPRLERLRSLQKPLAGRVVLQVDQAAPAHQAFLRHLRKCCQEPRMDRRGHLPAGGHREEPAEP